MRRSLLLPLALIGLAFPAGLGLAVYTASGSALDPPGATAQVPTGEIGRPSIPPRTIDDSTTTGTTTDETTTFDETTTLTFEQTTTDETITDETTTTEETTETDDSSGRGRGRGRGRGGSGSDDD